MSFKVTWKLHIFCFTITYLVCLLVQEYILNLFIWLLEQEWIIAIAGNIYVDLALFIVFLFIPITIVHEALHGVAYTMFGGKVKYGFKGVCAYTQEVSGVVLHRSKFLIVLLLPLTVISLISICVGGSIGAAIFLFNTLGSVGDLIMAFYLCKSNENSYIEDKSYGFDVITR
ncbi:DUF3267 domain-containing protein [Clostridium sp.]|uniref:DUF3267 domain-containing protein n=1 Tax=Clostridium sp. TaxID=1506 RepID=UPI003463C4BC